MFLFDWFRSFLPLHNPIGFGAADFVELEIATLLLLLIVLRGRVAAIARQFAAQTWWCMGALFTAALILRLALLPTHPVPHGAGADDFSYLLLGDTLAHFRLANATHPMHRFFEAVFILQEPSYASIYPIGQGIALALGQFLGHPWFGVLLAMAALPAACYWMLRKWVVPEWALVGGILALIQFGPLNAWTNEYWGGALTALAGCLVFGGAPGPGLALAILTRPFEAVLLLCGVKPSGLLPGIRSALFVAAALLLALLHNHSVTHSWITLPYQVSRDQYGVPATFTTQPNPTPHRPLTAEQQLDYEAQTATHGPGTDTPAKFIERLFFRVRFLRFFFLPPLLLALPFFLPSLRTPRYLWAAAAIAIFFLGTNFYPYFYPHYIAALTPIFLLITVVGLERMSRRPAGREAARLVLILCAAHFAFWYIANAQNRSALTAYETWDFINTGDPEGRIAIEDRLARAPGKQLVFVRYWPQHMFHEWIHNAANIDAAQTVWAADLGPEENEKLRRYYPDRTAWLVEPDAHPPRLTPY